MSGGRYKAGHKYRAHKRPVSEEEKLFIKMVSEGVNRSKAFRVAFPQHPTVKRYIDAVKNDAPAPVKRKASTQVTALSKDKLQTNHIQSALNTYQTRMDVFSDKSLETAIDLVENARSEKVRADLAIEGMRHRVGTPVQKVQVQEEKNVYIGFSNNHPDDDTSDIIEGEIVEDDEPSDNI